MRMHITMSWLRTNFICICVCTYMLLFLSGFQFLVQLLGNNLSVDELPGGAVEMDGVSDRDSEKVSEDRGSRRRVAALAQWV